MVGSTAFKAKALKNGNKLNADWVYSFRDFYRQFPELLDAEFRDTKSGRGAAARPKLWKIIGDEILFCCRIADLQHLSCCINAFLSALEQYGASLSGSGLDVKGAGWIGEFPAKNITLAINDGAIEFELATEDLPTEEFERRADETPHNFDFLGSAIDTGFRAAKHADADKFAMSAELGALLAHAKDKQIFLREFRYDGRLSLKGVNGDHPYPVVFIDTERDPGKRDIRTRERFVLKDSVIDAVAIRDFLKAYLSHHNYEIPTLLINADDQAHSLPVSYQQYRQKWQDDLEGAQKQDDSFDASATAGDDAVDKKTLTAPVKAFALRKQSDAAKRSLREAWVQYHIVPGQPSTYKFVRERLQALEHQTPASKPSRRRKRGPKPEDPKDPK
ncbi:hypothetical protein ACK9YZ_21800 [Rhizobium sp. ZK1]|uniref:hypothetical protein n=1 Tax=Rhizobium sp. ZK1 TaxID=3389872 RepID=UPI0039F70B92